jgi:hypothetical protein
MAGLGLIHLGFLAATAAVAVPILIHLLLRPRARRVEIGSVRLLRRVLKDSTRRRKLRRWLLLALRATIVLLLALLFARPYLSGAGADGREREVILLIDQSASMSVSQSGQTLFDTAQQEADKVLRNLPEQTAVHVAYFDANGVEPAEDPRIDRARQAGYAGTDYAQAIRWARAQLVLSPRRQRQIYLFSDLQRTGLRGTETEVLTELPVAVAAIGKPPLRNLAVVRAEAPQTSIRPGEPVVVAAQVRNAGPFPERDLRVRLVLDGPDKLTREQAITVGSVSVEEARFTLPIEKAGLYTGFVEIAGADDVPADDRRWLAFEARTVDRVLLVDGEPGRTVYANETYYLEAALRLRLPGQGVARTPYEPERLAWGDGAVLPELDRFRLVALCNVPGLAETEIKKLRAFVSGGGSLLVFTGGRVLPAGYEPLREAGLLPAAVEGIAGPELFHFASWEREHPIFRPLSDPQQGDLRRLAFLHVTRLKPVAGAKVLAAATGGEPLMIEGRLGDGVVLLVAAAADRDWGNWPQSRLYVPLVHQMAGHLTERLPENARVRTADAGPGRENPPGIERSGRMTTVRNLDPAESEIERFTVPQLRELFHLAEPDGALKEQSTEAGVSLPGSQRPDELWVYLVWALLLVLVIEVFVANRTQA